MSAPAGLDLDYDDGQLAIADAVAQFCRDRWDDEAARAGGGALPRDLWHALAALGVLAAASPDEEGGALEVCAAVESLGRAVFPGPLAGTYLALQVLPADERAVVAEGRAVVSAGTPPLLPFAAQADVFLEIAGDAVHRATPQGAVEAVETMGGEPWGRVRLERGEALAGAEAGLALADVVSAAYLAAAGLRLVDDAAEHARTRQQFGRPIGEFQAVAHPLADCQIKLGGARALARAAAWRIDQGEPGRARDAAATARLSARAASVHAAHVCHQVFGAVGITLEGPAFHVSRRILQLASQPPGADAARARLLAGLGLAA